MKIGTYYYPEQWPREQWQRDFDNIAAMGMQIVHMAEFAWFDLEPAPGEFRFDWLSECVEMARQRKLDVILCTPTAAIPIWLAERHPEVLLTDDAGRRMRFGGRRQYNPLAPAMHDAARRIVSALADRFGDHPSVIGWQIDNEYSASFDQSETTHQAFQDWLRRRYGTVQALNAAWGCQFWNTYYTDFAQVRFPQSRQPRYDNPHHRLDGSRFWSWSWAQVNRIQAQVLRPKVGERFITTNFMPFHLDARPDDMAEDLSLISWDSYPVSGRDAEMNDDTYRIGAHGHITMMHDYAASIHNRFAVMELQPGHVNWSPVPALLYPGAVRLWIWTAFAYGSEFVTTYRYRQPRFGIEMFHEGLIGPDGVTPSQGGREFAKAVEEVQRLDLQRVPKLGAEIDPQRTVGLLFDFEQLWYYETLPQGRRFKYVEWCTYWYTAAVRMGLRVRILHPGKPWPAGLKMIMAPGLQMVDPAWVERMSEFASAGGHLLLTCRTATMDRTGQVWEGPTAAPIVPLIGGTVENYDVLPDGQWGAVELDGKRHRWGAWGELLYAEPGTKALAKYADQFYAGAAAVLQRKHGSGVVTYCGVYGDAPFTSALFEKLSAQAGLDGAALPARVHVVRRGPYRVLLNYQDKPVEAPAPRGARFVVGGKRVEAAGVAVWEE